MERRQEGMIDAILASLAKAEASIGESSSEVYVGSLFGPLCRPGLTPPTISRMLCDLL
jgi:hypothetical protein